MSVLLIAEHNNKQLKPFTLNAVTAASQIDADVHAVVIGQNCGDASKMLSELPLVKKVLQVEAEHYENFVAETSNEELQSILIHEALHVVFEHPLRRGGRNHKLFNIACDYAINNYVFQQDSLFWCHFVI